MQRNREHIAAIVEGLLRAVTVMHVPVHHSNPIDQSRVDRAHDAKADVVEDAETSSAVALGVVTGRTRECVGIVDLTVCHGRDCGNGAANGQSRDVRGARPEGREFAGIPACPVAHCLHTSHVIRQMKALQVLVRCRAEVERLHLPGEFVSIKQILQLALGLGIFHVHAGLQITLDLIGT